MTQFSDLFVTKSYPHHTSKGQQYLVHVTLILRVHDYTVSKLPLMHALHYTHNVMEETVYYGSSLYRPQIWKYCLNAD